MPKMEEEGDERTTAVSTFTKNGHEEEEEMLLSRDFIPLPLSFSGEGVVSADRPTVSFLSSTMTTNHFPFKNTNTTNNKNNKRPLPLTTTETVSSDVGRDPKKKKKKKKIKKTTVNPQLWDFLNSFNDP